MEGSHSLKKQLCICESLYLDAPDAMFSSKFSPILEPADGGHGAAHGRAAKLHRVACRDGIELLLHTLSMGPIGTCVDIDQNNETLVLILK